MVTSIRKILEEDLDKWFGEKWLDISRINKDGSHPPCGASHDDDGREKDHTKAYPKCVKKSKAEKMTKKEKKAAVRRKRKKVNKKGDFSKPVYAKTDKKESAIIESLMDSYGDTPTVSGTAVFFGRGTDPAKISDYYRKASTQHFSDNASDFLSGKSEIPKCVRENSRYIAEAYLSERMLLSMNESESLGGAVEQVDGDHIIIRRGFYPLELAVEALNRRMGGTETLSEAKYQGRKVELNKPIRGGSKKFYVYVNSGEKTEDGEIKAKKVSFGSDSMEIKRDDPDRRRSFRARHNCDDANDKKNARYWSCKMWQKGTSVSDMLGESFFFRESKENLIQENAKKIWKKYYKDTFSYEDFMRIVKADPTSKDKSGRNPKTGEVFDKRVKGYFTQWLADSIASGKMEMSDLGQAKEYMEAIAKGTDGKPELPEIGGVETLKDFASNLPEKGPNLEDEHREVIYRGDRYLLVRPKTEEASCKYGANTRWCTAGKENNAFKQYTSDGGELYIIIDRRKDEKYQYHTKRNGKVSIFTDEEDNPYSPKHVDELLSFLPKPLVDVINSTIPKTQKIRNYSLNLRKFLDFVLPKDIDPLSFEMLVEGTGWVEPKNITIYDEVLKNYDRYLQICKKLGIEPKITKNDIEKYGGIENAINEKHQEIIESANTVLKIAYSSCLSKVVYKKMVDEIKSAGYEFEKIGNNYYINITGDIGKLLPKKFDNMISYRLSDEYSEYDNNSPQFWWNAIDQIKSDGYKFSFWEADADPNCVRKKINEFI